MEIRIQRRRARKVRVRMLLRGGRGKQDEAGRRSPAVFFAQCLLNELVQVLLELRQAIGSVEGFIVSEECEKHVRTLFRQPVIGRAKSLRTQAHREFIPRESQVPEHEPMAWKPRVQKRFQPAGMLHPLGERIADRANPVPMSQLEGIRSQSAYHQGKNREAGEQKSMSFHVYSSGSQRGRQRAQTPSSSDASSHATATIRLTNALRSCAMVNGNSSDMPRERFEPYARITGRQFDS